MLKFALIVGSTRPNRFADKPKQWVIDGAGARKDFALEVLDLRDFKLPMFEEPTPPAYAKGVFTSPAAKAWGLRLAAADGFIVGSYFKVDGHWANAVDPKRVERFMTAHAQLGG